MTANKNAVFQGYYFSTNQRKNQNLVFEHTIRQVNVSCPPSPRLNTGKKGMIAGYASISYKDCFLHLVTRLLEFWFGGNPFTCLDTATQRYRHDDIVDKTGQNILANTKPVHCVSIESKPRTEWGRNKSYFKAIADWASLPSELKKLMPKRTFKHKLKRF